ncbi:tetraacyldisaccharide 4'-kinase [Kiritimatiella glycovorans]|uniref:Tetraacyldisaccharide 4'-kinase n=1 Tax=Kiritimatiella glycovorans TaxID=1307763 RepID=A0A0G3EI17_9BACT|nr:tetraacyldisaccharide 4'-kinase [Kiritimatiella glycovorans]AKJ64455.1 Tetraacyldisaccharide 4'-kinase [Kiritimatiella glycovorans]
MQRWQEKLEEYVLGLIEGRITGRRAAAGRGALRALSWLYGGAVQLRLALYRAGLIRPNDLGCQVISIGNMTVGGTGKTPVVEVFARALEQAGRRVAILSRGYRSVKPPVHDRLAQKLNLREGSPPRVVSDGRRLLLDSAMSGDEPYMLASNLPEVTVLVDKDRVKSGKYAIRRQGCDTLILDDGFQYLSLRHRLDIVLVDARQPFGYERMLPRGLLREPMRNIKRAGFIFITKCGPGGAPELRRKLRELNPHAEISECCHRSKYVQDVFRQERYGLEWLRGRRVAALSAIAVPESFESELSRLGAELVHTGRRADHHRYSQQEVIEFVNRSIAAGAEAILTTEKDAVRMPFLERRDVPILFLRVEIEMLSGDDAFRDWIRRICFE